MKRSASIDLADLAQLRRLRRPPDKSKACSTKKVTTSLDTAMALRRQVQQQVTLGSPRYTMHDGNIMGCGSVFGPKPAAQGVIGAIQDQQDADISSVHAVSGLLPASTAPGLAAAELGSHIMQHQAVTAPQASNDSIMHLDNAQTHAAAAAAPSAAAVNSVTPKPSEPAEQPPSLEPAEPPAALPFLGEAPDAAVVDEDRPENVKKPSIPAPAAVGAAAAAAHGANAAAAPIAAVHGTDAVTAAIAAAYGADAATAAAAQAAQGTEPAAATTAASTEHAAQASAAAAHKSRAGTDSMPDQPQRRNTEDTLASSDDCKQQDTGHPTSSSTDGTPAPTAAPEAADAAAMQPAAAAAAVPADASGALTVTGLKSVLQGVCADKHETKEHILPVRYLAKLLHAHDVDFSTVCVSDLLPQTGVLLQHMRDRLGGKVEGKSLLQPHNAARHAKCLLFVLGLPEVQAVLGDDQQQQLMQAVQAAQQQFEAQHTANTAAALVPACPEAAQGQMGVGSKLSADSVKNRTTGQGYTSRQSAAAVADACQVQFKAADREQDQADPVGMSVAQLLALIVKLDRCPKLVGRARTTVNKLLQLVYGTEADAEAVQAPGLLQQWPALYAHLLRRVHGLGPEPSIKPDTINSCYIDSMLHVLRMPQLQKHFTSSDLQQLQQQLKADKAGLCTRIQLVPKNASSPAPRRSAAVGSKRKPVLDLRAPSMDDAAAKANSDDDSLDSQIAPISDAAAASAGATLVTTVGCLKQKIANHAHINIALNGVAGAAGFDGSNRDTQLLSAVLQPQYVQQYLKRLTDGSRTQKHIQQVTCALRAIVKRPDVQLLLGCDGVQQLQQVLGTPKQQQQSKGLAAATGTAAAAAPTGVAEGSSRLAARRKVTAGGSGQHRRREAEAAGPLMLEHPGPATAAATSATGLSLAALATHIKRARWGSSLINALAALRYIAKMLHGGSYDADEVQVAELLRHWGKFEQQLQQQVSKTHPTLPAITTSTAVQHTRSMLMLLEQPILQAQLSSEKLEQLQAQVAASRVALSNGSGHGGQDLIDKQMQPSGLSADAAGKEPAAAATAVANSQQVGEPHRASSGPTAAVGSPEPAHTATEQLKQQTALGPATPAPAPTTIAAPGSTAAAAPPAALAAPPEQAPVQPGPLFTASCTTVRDLLAAQRQLLWLYTNKLQPSMADLRAFRAAMKALSRLQADDIRLDEFWQDHDWILVLAGTADSTVEDWRDAFSTLVANVTKNNMDQAGPGAAGT